MINGPTSQQRTIILGRTGTGKSQFAIALLSTRDWHLKPWTIIDYKGEDLLEDILEASKGAIKEIKVTDTPPKSPGLYYMRPAPRIDDAAINNYLYKVWKQGDHGLFIDEGYALPQGRSDFFDTILTQGRSLHIPVIVLYQRPSWMSRFAVAQSDFRACFALDDERDSEIAARYIKPATINLGEGNKQIITAKSPLPKYHCLWYDVSEGVTSVLSPAPDRNEIINAFIERLQPVKRKALI